MICVCLAALVFPTLIVRMGTAVITPPENLPLGGYTSRKGALGHPYEALTCRTLVLSQGETKVAIVSVETLTISDSFVREVKKRIPPNVNLFLCATHTHSAPDSQLYNDRMTLGIPGVATFKRKWLEWAALRVASGVNQALASPGREISRLWLRTASAVAFNRHRRKGSQPSTLVSSLYADDTGKTQTLVTTFAAHATLEGPEQMGYSGDWPGEIERVTSAPFLPAAIGDVSPISPPNSTIPGTNPPYKIYATNLLDVLEHGTSNLLGGTLQFTSQTIRLGAVRAHPAFAKDNGVPESLAQAIVKKFAPTDAAISIVRIGTFAIVGVPGEPSTDLGHRIEGLCS